MCQQVSISHCLVAAVGHAWLFLAPLCGTMCGSAGARGRAREPTACAPSGFDAVVPVAWTNT